MLYGLIVGVGGVRVLQNEQKHHEIVAFVGTTMCFVSLLAQGYKVNVGSIDSSWGHLGGINYR